MTELEQTLSEALSYARIPELPADVSEAVGTWTKAIVLVKKTNNRLNYAVARNDGNGGVNIIKDFGAMCRVTEVLNIYPFSFISLQYQPNLKTKEDIINYLVSFGEDRDKIKKLLADTHPNKIDKSAKRKEEDNAAIKALVMKYTIAEENRLKAEEHNAIKTAFYENDLPEIEEAPSQEEPLDVIKEEPVYE